MEQKASEILKAARKLLEKPENWGQQVYIQWKIPRTDICDTDEDSSKLCAALVAGKIQPTECRFCALGAVHIATKSPNFGFANPLYCSSVEYLYQAVKTRGTFTVAEYNDIEGRAHEDILAVYDDAIALAIAAETAETER